MAVAASLVLAGCTGSNSGTYHQNPEQCPIGTFDCSGTCIDSTNDVAHCGRCANACGPSQSCVEGECVCPPGTTACASGCVDTSSDPTHCGSCDHACAAPEVCSKGECKPDCDAGLAPCGQECVDLSTSVYHCGSCSSACTGGLTCNDGGCGCPAGLLPCDQTCVNTRVAPLHCGSCGTTCGAGETCAAGQCSAGSALGSGGSDRGTGIGSGGLGGSENPGGTGGSGGVDSAGGLGGSVGAGGSSESGGSNGSGGTTGAGGTGGTTGPGGGGSGGTGGTDTPGASGSAGGAVDAYDGPLHGYFPTTVTADYAQGLYEAWKEEWVESCGDGSLRVKWDDEAKTVSEGIGYGMLLAASWEDRTAFDGLWEYFQNHMNGNGMMGWIGDCGGSDDSGSATDADLDAAMALIMADCVWPDGGYGGAATALIDAIRELLLWDDGSRVFLCAGDNWSGDCCGNASYQTPAYYRAFGQHVGDESYWNEAADDTYHYLTANSNATTGLVSDWMDPETLQCNAKGWGDWHGWDASRVPWRVATDYVWWENRDAESYATTVATFVESQGGIPATCQGYTLDGSTCEGDPVATFAGAFAAAGMALSQSVADAFFEDLQSVDSSGYFSSILNTLYFTLAVGRFEPGCYVAG